MSTNIVSPGNPSGGILESAPPPPPGVSQKPPMGNMGAVSSEPQSNSAQAEVAQRAMAVEKLLLSIGEILPGVGPQLDQIIDALRNSVGGALGSAGQAAAMPQSPMGTMGAMMGGIQQ